MSAILHPLGWALGLVCCVAAIYVAAGAALERPDMLRLEADAATTSASADYSVDPEQARRPPLNPRILGAIAVDEDALGDSPTQGPDDAIEPGGDEDTPDPSTPRPRANAVTPEPTSPHSDTSHADPTSTSTPRTKPTATKSPQPESTATATAEPEPTRTNTPVPTNTAKPTKTPKIEPTSTKTPLPVPTIKNPSRCRTPEVGLSDHGNSNDHRRRCATPTPWPDALLDEDEWW